MAPAVSGKLRSTVWCASPCSLFSTVSFIRVVSIVLKKILAGSFVFGSEG